MQGERASQLLRLCAAVESLREVQCDDLVPLPGRGLGSGFGV